MPTSLSSVVRWPCFLPVAMERLHKVPQNSLEGQSLFPQPLDVSIPGEGGQGAATLIREIFITQQFSFKIRKWILLFVFMRLLEAGS